MLTPYHSKHLPNRITNYWVYGIPSAGDANYAWVQHFIHHLAPTVLAGFVLANGSFSSRARGGVR